MHEASSSSGGPSLQCAYHPRRKGRVTRVTGRKNAASVGTPVSAGGRKLGRRGDSVAVPPQARNGSAKDLRGANVQELAVPARAMWESTDNTQALHAGRR